MRPIFDGHLDLALYATAWNRDMTEDVATINERESGMTDDRSRGGAVVSLPEMRRGRVAICQSTVAARACQDKQVTSCLDLDHRTQAIAYAHAYAQLSYYRVLQEQGEIQLIGTQAELNAHWDRWVSSGTHELPIGLIVSMEGADPIVEPEQAAAWWNEGVRSVMLTHFGKSHYAAGTWSTGPLTAKGHEVLKEFERIGMVLDLTHLCDESFFQAMDAFDGPVIASHSNCRTLVNHERQFTDEQLKLLIERGAVIGSALDGWMLVNDWSVGDPVPDDLSFETYVDHIDHVCQLAGNSHHAGIGTDTGARYHMANDFRVMGDLRRVEGILESRGYSAEDIGNILFDNWLRFFRCHLPE